MKQTYKILIASFTCLMLGGVWLNAQISIKGKVRDAGSGDDLIGASVLRAQGDGGALTNYEGEFNLKVESLPVTIKISYTGYQSQDLLVTDAAQKIDVRLKEASILMEEAVVVGQRIDDKQKAAPLTVENMDAIAIKQTAAVSFYNGLGNLKGVDLTTASLGFTIINTRGFNSTSPVRSLQIIDGVDNQAPGLNFSLGNFLGSSDLDVIKVDLIQGASSAFYGPNAFNGVISMETKNPFVHRGLAGSVKYGSRNMAEAAIRWAEGFKNKNGDLASALKINLFYLRADDWEANNYGPVDGTKTGVGNPGRWDAVNIYGDEYFSLNDFSDPINLGQNSAGLGIFHRTGYKEPDLVDYDTKNLKAGLAYHIRLKPSKEFESPELIFASNFGTGTTVYQGDNRFSLRGIKFFQNRIEIRKKGKYFLRAYATNEDAGRSYDPYFTALRLQEEVKKDEIWSLNYNKYWGDFIFPQMQALEYPQKFIWPPGQPFPVSDTASSLQWLREHIPELAAWHLLAEEAANKPYAQDPKTKAFLVPGTPGFQEAFDRITSLKSTEGGTRFYDKSALYHVHGEYIFNPKWTNEIHLGANGRLYTPISAGTIFKDTAGVGAIRNFEFGIYGGVEKKFFNDKLIANVSARVDKNENFKWVSTPAASLVWNPKINNYLRFSFSSAVRNPTLTDQYLNLKVGRAILLGNLDGFNDLVTVESFYNYRSSFKKSDLDSFDVAPIQPERVKTFEVGYRTTLFKKLYIDAGYYYSFYNDFIGYNIGISSQYDSTGFPRNPLAYRVAANSKQEVTTQGLAIGINYYFATYYQIAGNYSWNKLNKAFPDDPIIPAFNTPEHKYNVSISGRDVPLNLGFVKLKKTGFNVTYKWIQGFTFEGSPQFTGSIPTYDMVDAQVNATFDKIHTTVKIGASNLLNNKVSQTYGGPAIGTMAYASIVYDFVKK